MRLARRMLRTIVAERHGIDYRQADGGGVHRGVALNELTGLADRDPIAGTPWHKHVAARIERADAAPEVAA